MGFRITMNNGKEYYLKGNMEAFVNDFIDDEKNIIGKLIKIGEGEDYINTQYISGVEKCEEKEDINWSDYWY